MLYRKYPYLEDLENPQSSRPSWPKPPIQQPRADCLAQEKHLKKLLSLQIVIPSLGIPQISLLSCYTPMSNVQTAKKKFGYTMNTLCCTDPLQNPVGSIQLIWIYYFTLILYNWDHFSSYHSYHYKSYHNTTWINISTSNITHHFISYRVVSYHIVLYHIISDQIRSRQIISYPIISYPILYHIQLNH